MGRQKDFFVDDVLIVVVRGDNGSVFIFDGVFGQQQWSK